MLALYRGALLSGRVLAQALLARIGTADCCCCRPRRPFSVVSCSVSPTTCRAPWPESVHRGGIRLHLPAHGGEDRQPFSLLQPFGLQRPLLTRFYRGHAGVRSIGFMAEWWGIRAMMIVPLLGTCMVFLLLAMIVLEARLSEGQAAG